MTTIRGAGRVGGSQAAAPGLAQQGIAADQVVPALQQLEEFRHRLCQADHLLIQTAQEHELPERHCLSSVEKLVAQVLRISYGDAKRRVRAAVALAPRTSMTGASMSPLRPELAAAQAAGELSAVGVDLILHTLDKVDVVAPSLAAETETLLLGYGRAFEPDELARICDRCWTTWIRTAADLVTSCSGTGASCTSVVAGTG